MDESFAAPEDSMVPLTEEEDKKVPVREEVHGRKQNSRYISLKPFILKPVESMYYTNIINPNHPQ